MSNEDPVAIANAIGARDGRTVQVIGERVARVETKIEGLEKDTSVIRSTLHSMNGRLQETSLHEANCARALAQIADQTRCVPELVAKISSFDDLKPKMLRLIEERAVRRFAWKGVLLSGSAIVGLAGVFTGLAAILAYFLPHLQH